MSPPRTVRMMFVWIFLLLGTVFTLVGLLSFFVDIPTRGGEARDFLPIGKLLLLAGTVLALSVYLTGLHSLRLKAGGRTVPGTVLKIQYHTWVRFNRNHPWSVLCSYQWEGQTYQVRSGLLWKEPMDGQRPAVYFDPDHPRRAFLDPETLQYKL